MQPQWFSLAVGFKINGLRIFATLTLDASRLCDSRWIKGKLFRNVVGVFNQQFQSYVGGQQAMSVWAAVNFFEGSNGPLQL